MQLLVNISNIKLSPAPSFYSACCSMTMRNMNLLTNKNILQIIFIPNPAKVVSVATKILLQNYKISKQSKIKPKIKLFRCVVNTCTQFMLVNNVYSKIFIGDKVYCFENSVVWNFNRMTNVNLESCITGQCSREYDEIPNGFVSESVFLTCWKWLIGDWTVFADPWV